ncbi:unnamed protein product, partial [Ectocarpus fasciculatus]
RCSRRCPCIPACVRCLGVRPAVVVQPQVIIGSVCRSVGSRCWRRHIRSSLVKRGFATRNLVGTPPKKATRTKTTCSATTALPRARACGDRSRLRRLGAEAVQGSYTQLQHGQHRGSLDQRPLNAMDQQHGHTGEEMHWAKTL